MERKIHFVALYIEKKTNYNANTTCILVIRPNVLPQFNLERLNPLLTRVILRNLSRVNHPKMAKLAIFKRP